MGVDGVDLQGKQGTFSERWVVVLMGEEHALGWDIPPCGACNMRELAGPTECSACPLSPLQVAACNIVRFAETDRWLGESCVLSYVKYGG